MSDDSPLIDPDHSLAILFGVSHYVSVDDPYPPLRPYVENNLSELSATLRDLVGFKYVQSITNPKRADIIHTLEIAKIEEPYLDTLFVYYCGHGDIAGGQYYITGSDSFTGSKSSCLLFSEFEQEFLRYPAKKRVLVLDSCFSGRAIAANLADGTAVIEANVERLAAAEEVHANNDPNRKGLFVLASSDKDKSSSAKSESDRYTAFTGLFLKTLRNGIQNTHRHLNLNEIAEYLTQQTQLNRLPRPVTSDKYGLGAWRFIRNNRYQALVEGAAQQSSVQGVHLNLPHATQVGADGWNRRASRGQVRAHLSIAGSVDAYFARQSPMAIWGISIILGLILIWSSTFFRLDHIQAPPFTNAPRTACSSFGKQIGLWASLNWSVVYLALFPAFLICISSLARYIRRTIDDFIEHGVLIYADGSRPERMAVHQALDDELRSNNTMFFLLIGAVVFLTFGGWWTSSGSPLFHFHLDDQILDWSTVTIVCGWRDQQYSVLVYTLIAYMWMGLALFVYLSCLFLGFIYASFLSRLAVYRGYDSSAGSSYRLFFQRKVMPRYLCRLLLTYTVACILGLLAGYFMRFQAKYLYSGHTNLADFWSQDYQWLAEQLRIAVVLDVSANIIQDPRAKNQTLLTALAVTAVTVVSLLGTTWLIHSTFQNAKDFVVSSMPAARSTDRGPFHNLTEDEVGKVEATDFRSTVVPYIGKMAALAGAVVVGTVFPENGLLFTAMLLLPIAQYGLEVTVSMLRWNRGR